MDIEVGDKFVNTHLLHEMADFYNANGKYTFYKEDSIPHRQLRKREEYRRSHGYEAPCFMRNGEVRQLHISGDMYNYLNYIIIEQLDEKLLFILIEVLLLKRNKIFLSLLMLNFGLLLLLNL